MEADASNCASGRSRDFDEGAGGLVWITGDSLLAHFLIDALEEVLILTKEFRILSDRVTRIKVRRSDTVRFIGRQMP